MPGERETQTLPLEIKVRTLLGLASVIADNFSPARVSFALFKIRITRLATANGLIPISRLIPEGETSLTIFGSIDALYATLTPNGEQVRLTITGHEEKVERIIGKLNELDIPVTDFNILPRPATKPRPKSASRIVTRKG